jgi:cbb3-type cytochrome c oxidase subunit III
VKGEALKEENNQTNSGSGMFIGIPITVGGMLLLTIYFSFLATGPSLKTPTPGAPLEEQASAEDPPEDPPVEQITSIATVAHSQDPASVAAGKQIYDTYCIACHQPDGVGKVGFAPFIRNHDFLALATDKFLHDTIVAGRPGTAMVGWAHLKPKQISNIISYLRFEKTPHTSTIARADPNQKHPGDAGPGKDLFGQYCAACHGENANGYAEGGPGPAIGNAGFLAAASDDFIYQTVKHGRRGTAMLPFSGSRGLANLSDDEISNIIAFLRSRGTKAPEVVVVKSEADPKAGEMHFKANCAACHQADGTGLPGFAPSIRNRDFLALASDDFIKQTVQKGRPGTSMVQRPDLSDQILTDIVAYLRAVPVATQVHITVDPSKDLASLGKSADGHEKYTIYCAACHGEGGKGYVAGGAGPAIGLSGFLDAASDDYIYQTLKLGRMGTAMKPFLGAKGLANLNDQDAHDIIAYLRGLRPAN